MKKINWLILFLFFIFLLQILYIGLSLYKESREEFYNVTFEINGKRVSEENMENYQKIIKYYGGDIVEDYTIGGRFDVKFTKEESEKFGEFIQGKEIRFYSLKQTVQ